MVKSKVVTRTYDNSQCGASYDYENITPYHIEMIEAVLMKSKLYVAYTTL